MNISSKEFTPTALLCYFLGIFGAHRFYTGRTGSAIVMLVLSLTLVGLIVSAIWALVDFCYIASGEFLDSEGKEIKQPGTSPTKGLGTTMLLGYFLGALGIHRFYAGKIGTGVVMLILTISYFGYFISAIWALVDMIYISMGKFTDKDGNEIGHTGVSKAAAEVFA